MILSLLSVLFSKLVEGFELTSSYILGVTILELKSIFSFCSFTTLGCSMDNK